MQTTKVNDFSFVIVFHFLRDLWNNLKRNESSLSLTWWTIYISFLKLMFIPVRYDCHLTAIFIHCSVSKKVVVDIKKKNHFLKSNSLRIKNLKKKITDPAVAVSFEWKSLNVITINIIRHLLWSEFKCTIISLFIFT